MGTDSPRKELARGPVVESRTEEVSEVRQSAPEMPGASSPFQRLQRTIGNRALTSMLGRGATTSGRHSLVTAPSQAQTEDESADEIVAAESAPARFQKTHATPPDTPALQRDTRNPTATATPAQTASTTATPPTPDADRALARQIRQAHPDGIMVLMSIPDAVAEGEQGTLTQAQIDDGYVWEATLQRAAARPGIQQFWAQYRHSHPESVAGLPEQYADANARQKSRIVAMIYAPEAQGGYRSALRNWMWEHMAGTVQSIYFSNNHQFQRDAGSMAQSHHAVGLNAEGALALDSFMIYGAPEQIGQNVNAVSRAVLALLQRTHQTGDPPDERVARVGALGLFAHGSPDWMGGHLAARSASVGAGRVRSLVASMSDALSPNLRVHLFACSTGADRGGHEDGETSFADTFRDALVETHHDQATVIGHTSSGRAMGNPDLRVFHGSEAGRDVRMGRSQFPEAFVRAEVVRLGYARNSEGVTAALMTQMRSFMMYFYADQSWLFPSMGTANPTQESLLADFQQAWQAARPDRSYADRHRSTSRRRARASH